MLDNKLPQVLDKGQRKNRVRYILQKMRKEGLVVSKIEYGIFLIAKDS